MDLNLVLEHLGPVIHLVLRESHLRLGECELIEHGRWGSIQVLNSSPVLTLVAVKVFVSLGIENVTEEKIYLDRAAAVLAIDRLPHKKIKSICGVQVPPLNKFLSELDQIASLLLISQGT